MATKHGYDFEKEIGKSLERLKLDKQFKNMWYYKLVDTYAYDWIKDYIPDNPRELEVHRSAQFKYQMVLPKVPADFLVLFKGVTSYVECKSSKDKLGFPLHNLKDHQLSMSEDIEKAGAPYYFYICKRQPRANILYILEAKTLREIIKVLKSGKIIKNKIAWNIIEKYAIHTIEKSRGCVFDLKEVF